MARVLLLLSLLSVLVSVALSDLTRIEHSLKNDESLAILVIGDWGRKGNYNQSLVAEQVLINDKLSLFKGKYDSLYIASVFLFGLFSLDSVFNDWLVSAF
jgi:hypothetical protein